MLPKSTDVLIVGAGPTGLALAIALQQASVDHILVDKLAEGQNTSRAAVIHAHTLEMLERLGVVNELTRRGLNLTRFTVRDRDRALLQLSFDKLPSKFAEMLMVSQHETEEVLTQRLLALGGTVQRNVTVVATESEGEHTKVTMSVGDAEHVHSARYVVGADGMHSVVRDQAGIGFEGKSYPESFVLADVFMDWSLGRDEVSLFFSPAGVLVVAPLPSGSFRIVATLEGAPERPNADDIQAILTARGPVNGAIKVREVVWSSRFRLHDRIATAYRKNGLLLMGDSAHVHSPAGGQGMNTGIVDSVVLGDLLAGVLKGTRPAADLDQYQQLRRPAATEVVHMAGRLTELATMRSATLRAIRNLAFRIADHLPPVKRRIELALSGLDRKKYAEVR